MKRLRKALGDSGLSAQELAAKMKVSKALVSHWTSGRREMSPEQVKRAAEVLGIEARWLLHGDGGSVVSGAPDTLASAQWSFRGEPDDGGQDFGNANVFATPPDLRTMVKETGQNVVDVPEPPGGHVHLRYSLIQVSKSGVAYKRFMDAIAFGELRSHLEAAGRTHSRLGTRLRAGLARVDAEKSMFLLRVEDYGTTGLHGGETKEGDTPNAFAALIRNNMDSSKSSTTATGSFGLGKAVLWRCSELSTIVLASDVAPNLRGDLPPGVRVIGKSEPTCHQIGSKKFAGPGWFGQQTRSLWVDDAELDALQLDRGSLPENISRERASGTSILILAFRDPKAELTSNPEQLVADIARHVAENFWPTMMRGQLSASVQYIADGDVKTKNPVDPTQYVPQLCEILSRHKEDQVVDELRDPGDVLRKSVSLTVPATTAGAADLLKTFDESQDASCHLLVRIAGGDEEENEQSGSVALVRGRGMVVKYWSRKDIVVGARPFHAVLLAGEFAGKEPADIAADQFLRLSEPPAHNEWEFNDDLRENYQRGAGRRLAEFMRAITDALREAIRPTDTAEDDGPDELRQLLQLQVRPELPKPAATLRGIEHEITDGRWCVGGEIHMNEKRKKYRVCPRLWIDGESGGGVSLPWEEIKIVDVGRGRADVSDDGSLIVHPGTSRVGFAGTSAIEVLGVEAARCRVKIDLHVEECE